MSNENIRLIQLNNYIRPKVEENKSKNWVTNGRNNSFYKYIIDRYNGSPTNATIINSYINLMYGNGLAYKGNGTEEWVKVVSVFPKKELRKVLADFVIFGEASLQIIKKKNGGLANIFHLPNEKVAPAIENEEGEIEGYWYCNNWDKQNQNPPEYFSAFGTSNDAIEIYCIKPYKAGKNYFSDPDYLAGLPYAEMEEEIANYYISHIKNGLSFGYIINIPDGNSLSPEEKDQLEYKIKQKLTGSNNAGKFILSFNGRDAEITVTPLQVNDAHKQWEYLTSEARQQLLTSHGVVSPMLFGIKDNTGLGNNADELDTAEAQLVKRVIQPKQRTILEALDEIFNFYGININLYFKPLTEATQITDVAMSSDVCCSDEKKNLFDNEIANELISLGEENSDEWELIESEILTNESAIHLTSTGSAYPNAKSELDGEKFKSRLRYGGEISSNSREFCRKMISANKIYRIEDIKMMSQRAVNAGWGANGADTYDILLYKGGGACRHFWIRETYRLKADVNSPLAETITPAQARKEGEILPKIDKKAYEKPNDMPNNGFLTKR